MYYTSLFALDRGLKEPWNCSYFNYWVIKRNKRISKRLVMTDSNCPSQSYTITTWDWVLLDCSKSPDFKWGNMHFYYIAICNKNNKCYIKHQKWLPKPVLTNKSWGVLFSYQWNCLFIWGTMAFFICRDQNNQNCESLSPCDETSVVSICFRDTFKATSSIISTYSIQAIWKPSAQER